MSPDELPPEEGDDNLESGKLDALFVDNPPRPAAHETVDRLAEAATRRLEKRRRRRRITAGVVGVAGTAAVRVFLARLPWSRVDAPAPPEQTAVRQPEANPGKTPGTAPHTASHTTPGPVIKTRRETNAVAGTPATLVRQALETMNHLQARNHLQASERTVLLKLRRRGPAVLAPLVEVIENESGDAAHAAARLLASLGTAEADAAALELLAHEDPHPQGAESLVAALLRRRDRAGRRLIRNLLDHTRTGHLVLGQLSRAHGLWATEILHHASTSTSLPLSSAALDLLSRRRPRDAATAFWNAVASYRDPDAVPTATPSPRLTLFFRAVLPRVSAATLALVENDLRGPPRRRETAADRRGPRRASQAAARRREWRVSMARALGRSQSREAWPLLIAIMETDGPTPSILEALGALGDARAVPALERFIYLHDDRAHAATRALAKIPHRRALRALLRAYQSMGACAEPFSPKNRALLTEALRARGAATLSELRADYSTRPDQIALGTLIELFPDAAGGELARLLPTADRRSRPQIFRALASLGTASAIVTLIDALEDPSLRVLARQSLTRIVRHDLGPRPDAWKRWLRENRKLPERLDAKTRAQRSGAAATGGLAPVLVLQPATRQKEEV